MWFLLAGFLAIGLAHTAPFPFLLEYADGDRSIWQGPRSDADPVVFLTFDDGPNPEATPALLDVLAAERVTATFFIIPGHVNDATAPIVRRAIDEGHGVAMHAATRALMLKAPREMADWLDRESARINTLVGAAPCRLFRPHAGWRSGTMSDGLAKAGYRMTGWGFSMWDFNWWRRPNPERLAARLADRASDGSIVVMHDGHHKDPRSDRQRTVDATRALIPRLRARGFVFRSVCDLAR